MSERSVTICYWALFVLFCTVLVAALVQERLMPSVVEQPPREELPEEVKKAQDLATSGNFVDAIAMLEDVIEQHPTLAFPHFLIAEIEMQRGNIRESEKRARMAIALEPRESSYRYFLSSVYAHVGWMLKAEEELGELLDIEPDNLQALKQRAEIYLLTSRFDKALEDMDFAVQVTEGHPEALAGRIRIRMFTGDINGARADLALLEASEDPQIKRLAGELKSGYGL